MDVIDCYVQNTEKVNFRLCLHPLMVPLAAGGMLAGQCCPPGVPHCSKPSNALGLLDTALPAHTPSLSLCRHQETLKIAFLESICTMCTLCRSSNNKDFYKSFATFCREQNLAEEIKVKDISGGCGWGLAP